jgi:hypothetical protein
MRKGSWLKQLPNRHQFYIYSATVIILQICRAKKHKAESGTPNFYMKINRMFCFAVFGFDKLVSTVMILPLTGFFKYRVPPQSTELTRDPPPRTRVISAHRRKSAACPKFDMIWLNPLPIPAGKEEGNFLVHMISTCLPSRRGRGGGVGTLLVQQRNGLCKLSNLAGVRVDHVQEYGEAEPVGLIH